MKQLALPNYSAVPKVEQLTSKRTNELMRALFLTSSLQAPAYYRQDAAKRQTAGNKFIHRPKIRFFAPQGRLVAPIHVKLGRADGHMGPHGCAKFHLNRHRGWEFGPKISEISTVW